MLSDSMPRLNLAHLPTPLQHLPRLSESIGDPEIYIKRDDCAGLALGGNKIRKLEYLLADAKSCGATTVITAGGMQSNHARLTAAAACQVGMSCELVLERPATNPTQAFVRSGNQLLNRWLGAKVHLVDADQNPGPHLDRIAAEVRSRGDKPYVIPVGGSNALGALGYVRCAEEILAQMQMEKLRFDWIVLASGSGGTQAGLLLGLRALGSNIPVLGIGVSSARPEQTSKVREVADAASQLLGVEPLGPDDIRLNCNHIGEGYGVPTDGMIESVSRVARLEGILLDPVYTGKAMAGLLHELTTGKLKNAKSVLFLHTGGAAGLFGYPDLI